MIKKFGIHAPTHPLAPPFEEEGKSSSKMWSSQAQLQCRSCRLRLPLQLWHYFLNYTHTLLLAALLTRWMDGWMKAEGNINNIAVLIEVSQQLGPHQAFAKHWGLAPSVHLAFEGSRKLNPLHYLRPGVVSPPRPDPPHTVASQTALHHCKSSYPGSPRTSSACGQLWVMHVGNLLIIWSWYSNIAV